MDLEIIPSASIILQRTTGEVLLCQRSKNVSFFPTFWVFPGGKIEFSLSEGWEGTETEVIQTILEELYEEIGVVIGSDEIVPPNDRSRSFYSLSYDELLRKQFKEKLIFIGKKQTPPFRKKLYNAAYYWIQDSLVDRLDPIVDGEELVNLEWIQPKIAILEWESGKRPIPPPILHILRNMENEHFVNKTLIETDLVVGLQTKVEFAPGYQVIPFTSNTIPPFFNTNCVIIEEEDEILITDPGANQTAKNHFKQILQSLKFVPKIFVTHHHKDHWEGLRIIEEIYPEAELYIHPDNKTRIDTNLKTIEIQDEIIRIGEKKLLVIDAPGHTDTHQVLFEKKEGILIAGDHVVGSGSAVLDPTTGSMKEYFSTTRKLIELNPKIIFPSHGPPNFEGKKLLKYYIKHRTERENAILNAIKEGKHTLDQIVKTVYQDVPQNMWEYAKRNIQLHIEKLESENRLPNLLLE